MSGPQNDHSRCPQIPSRGLQRPPTALLPEAPRGFPRPPEASRGLQLEWSFWVGLKTTTPDASRGLPTASNWSASRDLQRPLCIIMVIMIMIKICIHFKHFYTFSYIFIHFHTFSYMFIHVHTFSYIFNISIRFHTFLNTFSHIRIHSHTF